MRYVFLTACRNEEQILEAFLSEFRETLAAAGIAGESTLYVIDDLSTDGSVDVLERHKGRLGGAKLEILKAPTNLGNQGALFYALRRLPISPQDLLVTFDCDGEDDVREIPSIVAFSRENPDRVVLIERGARSESLVFRAAFRTYKVLFRFLTRQSVIPNNFLVIPGRFVPFIRRTPLAAVHFAYAILRTKFPFATTRRDRRTRYGGKSSQNLFMVASHGLVGLMVFYETVIAKLLVLLTGLGVFSLAVVAAALAVPVTSVAAQRVLLWVAGATATMGASFFSLLLAAALALIFKLSVFTLSQAAVEGDDTALTERRG